ncbi:MAG: hypothetical protein HKN08_04170 [Gammaproteobacteria bacterium]|nr:hypothetical protein [Gammaproteobacteria bacterium]
MIEQENLPILEQFFFGMNMHFEAEIILGYLKTLQALLVKVFIKDQFLSCQLGTQCQSLHSLDLMNCCQLEGLSIKFLGQVSELTLQLHALILTYHTYNRSIQTIGLFRA